MKRIHIVALAASGVLATGGLAWAEHHERRAATGVVSSNPTYEKECGACHMPFQPQFLPVRSWTALMSNLGSHFGDDATLDDTTRQAILTYLQANAGDAPGMPTRYLRGLAVSQTPLRISDTPFWVRAHQGEVAPSAYLDPKVKSKANCVACHAGAQQGVYEGD